MPVGRLWDLSAERKRLSAREPERQRCLACNQIPALPMRGEATEARCMQAWTGQGGWLSRALRVSQAPSAPPSPSTTHTQHEAVLERGAALHLCLAHRHLHRLHCIGCGQGPGRSVHLSARVRWAAVSRMCGMICDSRLPLQALGTRVGAGAFSGAAGAAASGLRGTVPLRLWSREVLQRPLLGVFLQAHFCMCFGSDPLFYFIFFVCVCLQARSCTWPLWK